MTEVVESLGSNSAGTFSKQCEGKNGPLKSSDLVKRKSGVTF